MLTPTRELAAQVEESVRIYGAHLSIKSVAVFGGVGIVPQIQTLKRGVDILRACCSPLRSRRKSVAWPKVSSWIRP